MDAQLIGMMILLGGLIVVVVATFEAVRARNEAERAESMKSDFRKKAEARKRRV